jgi:hypothetical protein
LQWIEVCVPGPRFARWSCVNTRDGVVVDVLRRVSGDVDVGDESGVGSCAGDGGLKNEEIVVCFFPFCTGTSRVSFFETMEVSAGSNFNRSDSKRFLLREYVLISGDDDGRAGFGESRENTGLDVPISAVLERVERDVIVGSQVVMTVLVAD